MNKDHVTESFESMEEVAEYINRIIDDFKASPDIIFASEGTMTFIMDIFHAMHTLMRISTIEAKKCELRKLHTEGGSK
jgi:hypothetical protein